MPIVIKPMSLNFGHSERINSAREVNSSGRQPLFLSISHIQHAKRFFTTCMNFNKDIQWILTLSKRTGRIQFLSQFYAIHTFYHPKIRNLAKKLITLSTLKVTNQMPFNVFGKDFCLVHQLLDIVLTKITMAIIIKFLNVLGRLLLTYSYNTRLFVKETSIPYHSTI